MPYLTIVVCTADCRRIFLQSIAPIAAELNIQEHDYEAVYDWCVMEALSSVLKYSHGLTLYGHYRDDLAVCVYREIGFNIEQAIKHQFMMHQIKITYQQKIKAMVAGDILLISYGKL